MSLPPLPLLAPILLLATAVLAFLHPGQRPAVLPRLAEGTALATLVLAIAGLVQIVLTGPAEFDLGGGAGLIAFRLDVVGVTMTMLVAFVGWVVVRYSRSYLDGEAREGTFHGLMLAALAAVLLLVQSGTLAMMLAGFVAVGVVLRQLLTFYPRRPEARRAAAKFALVWHGGDLLLALAAVSYWVAFGTSNFAEIGQAATLAMPASAQFAVALVVLAAILKTAAFPLHGWLTEVMEAPTPISALLHAGIINAGGVLLIRLAEPVQASPGAMAALVMIGGFTALFGAAVMLTQSAVKTALAWSTVSQMGFMLLQCGLGLWALALLHIVAHSLYKAHAFLAAGGAVQAVAAIRRPGPVAVPSGSAVLKSFALALAVYFAVALVFGWIAVPKPPQALALGAILVFGVAYLVAQGLADTAPVALTRRAGLAALAATFGYFGFHVVADALWGASLPAPPAPDALEWALVVVAVGSFGLIAVAQALFPHWAHHPAAAGLRVHVANGFYLNAALDRLIGGFRPAKTS